MRMRQKSVCLLLLQNRRPKREGLKTNCRELGFDILERERMPSLEDLKRSDRRIPSGQEGKWFYAERATRGNRFLGVSTKSVR